MIMKTLIALSFFLVCGFFAVGNIYASELSIEGNGENSTNDVSIATNQQTTIDQQNSAQYVNDVNVGAVTGGNTVSNNTGDNINVQTGDASITENIDNTGNTSFYEGSCCVDPISAAITENGEDSKNSVSLYTSSQTIYSVENNLTISNIVSGTAVTGRNDLQGNLGDVHLTTGEIKVNEFINNSGVNLTDVKGANSQTGTTIFISENGSGSVNTVSVFFDSSSSYFVNNDAKIASVSIWDLVTGQNHVIDNVGNINIETGDIVFNSVIRNDSLNFSSVDITCCRGNLDEGNDDPGPRGSDQVPQGTTPSPAIIASNTNPSSDNGKNDDESHISSSLEAVLPATGSWLLYAILFNIITLFMGVYLRLRSGRSPNIALLYIFL